MDYPVKLSFNPEKPTVTHIDLNSCFATIEQQANPFYRGKPLVVAAYTTPAGCILAPSIEAKEYGIKTGMRVKDGKNLFPGLIVLPSDPDKYRDVHLKLRKILSGYTNDFCPKSIDEFVLDLKGYPILGLKSVQEVGKEIKKRIKKEVGEWLTVSIGIATNRFLAKTASGLNKPDGLEEITKENFLEVYRKLDLVDLHGINIGNKARLNGVGINSVIDFYYADLLRLKAAFRSVLARYWYIRLRGWEIDKAEFKRKSFGNSYALPKSLSTHQELSPILANLTEKTGGRMRRQGFRAKGIYISLAFRDGSYWHKRKTLKREIFDSRDIYKEAYRILKLCPYEKPVRVLAESCFGLMKGKESQLELFKDIEKVERLVEAQDVVNDRWGDFTLTFGRILDLKDEIHDRISFGGVKEI